MNEILEFYSVNLFRGYECCSFMCVHAPHTCSTHKGQKRVEATLELQLQPVVSCYVENKASSYRGQQVLLTTEPSLAPEKLEY